MRVLSLCIFAALLGCTEFQGDKEKKEKGGDHGANDSLPARVGEFKSLLTQKQTARPSKVASIKANELAKLINQQPTFYRNPTSKTKSELCNQETAAFKIKASGDAAVFHADVDIAECMNNEAQRTGSPNRYQSLKTEVLYQAYCAGGKLNSLNGKSYEELEVERYCENAEDVYTLHSAITIAKMIISFEGKETRFTQTNLYELASPEQQACKAAQTNKKGARLRRHCREISTIEYSDYGGANGAKLPGVSDLYASFFRADFIDVVDDVTSDAAPFFTTGQIDFILNDWTEGHMYYKNANSPPSWTISNGSESRSGIFGAETDP